MQKICKHFLNYCHLRTASEVTINANSKCCQNYFAMLFVMVCMECLCLKIFNSTSSAFAKSFLRYFVISPMNFLLRFTGLKMRN